MSFIRQPMGSYQTNCYIVSVGDQELIIDPGQEAAQWVLDHVRRPVAILNTHGHFDHVWSNAALQKALQIPLYCPDEDAFMLSEDPYGQGMPPSYPDHRVQGDASFDIAGIDVRFYHFPGHSPGCSVIEIDGHWYSGDFLFYQSIGRWDFPYSDGNAMIRSLQKARAIPDDHPVHPGHGPDTTLAAEQHHISAWIKTVQRTV